MQIVSKTYRMDYVIKRATTFSVLAIALASCYNLTPKPTEAPSPTPTGVPTSTSTPAPTATTISIQNTATPSAPVLSLPSGVPLSEWNGIPVMPNAIAGDANDQSYSFTTKSSLDEIQAFYEGQLPKLGWKLGASGQGTTKAIMLIFTKDAEIISGTEVINMLTVTIIPQLDGVMYVMLAK